MKAERKKSNFPNPVPFERVSEHFDSVEYLNSNHSINNPDNEYQLVLKKAQTGRVRKSNIIS